LLSLRLLALAQETAKGIYWTISTAGSKEYPNFSHGTAGIGYFLSELYEATKDERYLLSALAAGYYLQSIVSKAESCHYLIFATMPVVGISSTWVGAMVPPGPAGSSIDCLN
jgi:lantibiotic modifying enzyme